MNAKVFKNLGTDSIISHICRETKHNVGLNSIISLILQGISFDFVDQTNASAFLLNHTKRRLKLFTAVTFLGAKRITCQAF